MAAQFCQLFKVLVFCFICFISLHGVVGWPNPEEHTAAELKRSKRWEAHECVDDGEYGCHDGFCWAQCPGFFYMGWCWTSRDFGSAMFKWHPCQEASDCGRCWTCSDICTPTKLPNLKLDDLQQAQEKKEREFIDGPKSTTTELPMENVQQLNQMSIDELIKLQGDKKKKKHEGSEETSIEKYIREHVDDTSYNYNGHKGLSRDNNNNPKVSFGYDDSDEFRNVNRFNNFY